MPFDPLQPLGLTVGDLAPADFRSAEFDWTGFGVSFIDSPTDERFDVGYDALWREFGLKNEMEQRGVIEQRLAWRPEAPIDGHALNYEMIVVSHDNELAAVRDHTAVVDLLNPQECVVVHLSHLLILPRFRGSGLAGWMRTLPIYTARECLTRAKVAPRLINLVAEMEPALTSEPGRFGRLIAYEKVGFKKIDPTHVHYLQPDFRTACDIDADPRGPQPIPLSLITRRVGREAETSLAGREVRTVVESLYTMYQQSFRTSDMAINWASLAKYPHDDACVELVPPTQV